MPPHSRPRPILPVAKRVRFGDDIPPHAPLASPVRDPGSSVRMPQNAPPSVPSTPTPFRCTTTGTLIVPLEPLAQRLEAWLTLPSLSRWLKRTIRLGYAIQFARRPPKFNGVLETSVAVRNAPVLQIHSAPGFFSRCGVRLCEYDSTEFLQRQECGTTETVSEAPGAYGIRSCSHAARIASYETTSALATLPGPEVGMAPRYTASSYLPAVSPLPQPLDRPCLSTGRGAPRTSAPAYCCHNRCLQHGLGRYMQLAGSLWALDRAPTALAHQLPGAVGSAFSLAAVPATAVGQARASPHGQHCGGLVYQPAGGYTITPHVTARPPSPPLESHAVQVTACCSHPLS